jgi:L-aspartate oxidase
VADLYHALPLENPPHKPTRQLLDLADIRNALKSLMWRSAGVRRDAEGLCEAAENLEHWCRYVLPHQFVKPSGWELQNMLCVARLMVGAAIDRQETRGCHVRNDFPSRDDERWNRHIAFLRE